MDFSLLHSYPVSPMQSGWLDYCRLRGGPGLLAKEAEAGGSKVLLLGPQ